MPPRGARLTPTRTALTPCGLAGARTTFSTRPRIAFGPRRLLEPNCSICTLIAATRLSTHQRPRHIKGAIKAPKSQKTP